MGLECDPATSAPPPGSRSHSIARPSLIRRLDGVFSARAGVVTGPAGSGKTTLLRSWVDTTRAAAVAFLSVGPHHRDPQLFGKELYDAIRASGAIGGASASMRELGELADLVSGHTVVVIDEVEALVGSRTVSAIRDLVANSGPSLRVIVSGRSTAGFGLEGLRHQGRLVELTAMDLRLTASETALVVRTISGELDEQVVATIHEQTGGWAAGVVLAGLVLRDGDRESSQAMSDLVGHPHFDHFLEHEVVDRLPVHVQRFLLDTCVLDPLFPDQCAALSGCDDAADLLRGLVRQQVFTDWLGGTPRAFRYHPLLRSWLIGRQSSARLTELAGRAADWSRENGRTAEAIDYLLAAHDIDRAVACLIEYAPRAFAEGRNESLVAWIDALPPHEVATNEELIAVYREAASRVGRHAATSVPYVAAASPLRLQDEGSEARARLRLGAQRGRHLLFVEGRPESAGDCALETLSPLDLSQFEPVDPEFTLADLALATDVNVCATQLLFAGHLSESIRVAGWVADTFAGSHPAQVSSTSNALGKIALCELLLGVRPSAITRARDAMGMCRLHRIDPDDRGWAESVLAVAGTDDERTEAVLSIERRMRRQRNPPFTCMSHYITAWSSIVSGDPGSARLHLERGDVALGRLAEPGVLDAVGRRVRRIVLREADEPALADRQLQVLAGLAAGWSRRKVADQLHLSVNTVKTYARLAYRSLGASSLQEAVDTCSDLGISLDLADTGVTAVSG